MTNTTNNELISIQVVPADGYWAYEINGMRSRTTFDTPEQANEAAKQAAGQVGSHRVDLKLW